MQFIVTFTFKLFRVLNDRFQLHHFLNVRTDISTFRLTLLGRFTSILNETIDIYWAPLQPWNIGKMLATS